MTGGAPIRITLTKTLDRRLFRQISRVRGQFASLVAVVAIGITVFVLMRASHRELYDSLCKYYDRFKFNDLTVQVRRAPASIVEAIRRVEGVAAAEGRLMFDARVEVGTPSGAGSSEKSITGTVVGIPDAQVVTVNDIDLLSGRRPRAGTGEVLVDPKFARAHGLNMGDGIVLYVHGRAARVTVCGTATGPEFIYATKDASTFLQDPFTFGIIFMSQNDMASLFGYNGEVNQILVRFAPGADAGRVKAVLDEMLDPYGRIASLERKDQFSHAAISAEFDQLRTMSTTLPTVFLMVGAAIMYISISRMVRDQRVQIGVMKAVGYSGGQILSHYTLFAVAGGLAGSLAGAGLGALLVPLMMSQYAMYFNLPLGRGSISLQELLGAVSISVAASMIAGYLAARGVLSLKPAEAMRPAAPPKASKTLLEGIGPLWMRLSFSWKMALRNLARHKARAALTVMGATFAVALLVMAMFMTDAVDYVFREGFFRRQRHDLAVTTVRPVGPDAVRFIEGLPGVIAVEPYSQYRAKLYLGGVEEEVVLKGMLPGSRMQMLVDSNGCRTEIPEDGILLSEGTARKIGAKVGDSLLVKMMDGAQKERVMLVRGVIQELVGGSAYASIHQVNALAGEQGSSNGIWVDSWDTRKLKAVLSESPVVASVSSPAEQAEEFEQMTGMLIFSVMLMTAFGLTMGYAIVYTVTSISIEERRRELAFMKALGLTSSEASLIVFNENTALSILGVMIGLPLGKAAAQALMAASGGTLDISCCGISKDIRIRCFGRLRVRHAGPIVWQKEDREA